MSDRLGVRGTATVAALALLVYSGFFKGSPLLAGFPIDLTVFGVGLAAVGLTAVLLRDPGRYRTALPAFALAVVFLLGVRHVVPGYGTTKVTRFYLITLVGIVAVSVLLCSERRRRAWVVAQIVLGLLLSLDALLSPPATKYTVSGAAALQAEGSNTIATGRAAGVAAVGLLILALASHGRRRFWCLAGGLAATYPLLNAGSRGPVAAGVIAVALVALLAPSTARSRLARVALVAFALGGGYVLLKGDTSGGAGRVTETLFSGNLTDSSSAARFTLWRDALGWIPTHPLGGGWGTFSLPHPGFDLLGSNNLVYPHNVLLEVTGEAGWVAGAAFVLYWAGSLLRLHRAAADPYHAVLFGIAIFALINAMVSNDVNDRFEWAAVAAGWALPGRRVVTDARDTGPAHRPAVGARTS